MSTEENKVIARRWLEEVWQKASPAAMDELLAPDIFFNYASPGVEPDRKTYKKEVNSYFVGFPDLQFTIEDMVAEEDKVAIRYTGCGTHKSEFWGIAPTGKEATMRGISIIRIKDGKIVEEWTYMNTLNLMEQLGAR